MENKGKAEGGDLLRDTRGSLESKQVCHLVWITSMEILCLQDWPNNPPNAVVCILCKNVIPFARRDPEHFFRHLITNHCTYFNLNLLLEASLAQPNAVSEYLQRNGKQIRRDS